MNKFSLEPRVPSDVWSQARLSLKGRQGHQAGFQSSCVKVNVYAGREKRLNWKFLKQTAAQRRLHGED